MTPGQIVLFLAACGLSSFVQAVTGFGFGILVMTAIPYLIPTYLQAVATSSLCGTTVALALALRCRKNIRWRLVLPMLLSYFVSSAWAIQFSLGQSKELLMRLLGIVLIGLSVYFFRFNGRIHIRPSFGNGMISGGLSGVLAGMFAAGGPPAVVYMLSAAEDDEQYRASLQAFFGAGGIYSNLVRWHAGILTPQVVEWWGMALIALGIGGVAGSLLCRRLDSKMLRRAVYAVMAFSGTMMLL